MHDISDRKYSLYIAISPSNHKNIKIQHFNIFTIRNNDIVYKGSSICGIGIFNGTPISPSPINGCPP